jgi:hypothetical protein
MKTPIYLLVLFSYACITDNGDVTRPLSAMRIQSMNISGRSISFVIRCETPTPCWTYVKTEQASSDNEIRFKVLGRSSGDPCVQVLSSLDAPATTILPSAGTYSFRFWQYNDKSIDTTITVQ